MRRYVLFNAYPARMPRSFLADADLDGEGRRDVTPLHLAGRVLPREGEGSQKHVTWNALVRFDGWGIRIIRSLETSPRQREPPPNSPHGHNSNASQQGGKVNKWPPHIRRSSAFTPRVLVGEAPSTIRTRFTVSSSPVTSLCLLLFLSLLSLYAQSLSASFRWSKRPIHICMQHPSMFHSAFPFPMSVAVANVKTSGFNSTPDHHHRRRRHRL